MNHFEDVLIIIPCFNEGDVIEEVVREVKSHLAGASILVVNDGSTDGSGDIAASVAQVANHCANLGIGGAVGTGIRYAAREGFSYCVQVDGDGQHPADQVLILLEQARVTGAEIVIGSRFLSESRFRSSAGRRIGIKLISLVLRLLFGRVITDPTSGLRVFNRQAIQKFKNRYPLDFPEPISTAEALRERMKIHEVAVEMRPRVSGESSINGLKSAAYMVRVCSYIVLNYFAGVLDGKY